MSPFTTDSLVRQVLAERPQLRELLPAFHPRLGLLRSSLIVRLLPSSLTLRGLARLAGTDPDTLVAVCNLPGVANHPDQGPPEQGRPGTPGPPPPWPADTEIIDLDLRADLKQGQEPFARIMEAWRQAPRGSVLRLRTPFRPNPLIDLMARKGATIHVSWQGSDCLCALWKGSPGDADGADDAEDLEALLAQRLRHRETDAVLDLHQLEPPLPLELALLALSGDSSAILPLVLRLPREPRLLYPLLLDKGLRWTVEPDKAIPGGVLVRVFLGPQ